MEHVPEVDVVGVGLNATDTLIALPEFPASGSKTEFHDLQVLPGGQTATAMVACANWGLRTRYVGKLGDDPAAQMHRDAFRVAGVDARILTAHNCPSAQSFILVDSTGERTVLLKRDPRTSLQSGEIERDWITTARALHVDGFDITAAIRAAQWARDAGIPVTADLDELYPGLEDLLPLIDHLIVSRDLPSRLTGQADLHTALKVMQQSYKNRLTAATLGQDGVLARNGDGFCQRPAYHVPVADTTGAGDIFHAAYLYGLLQGWPLERHLDFACAAAALNCTARGARGYIANVAEIEQLMHIGQLRL